MSSYFISEDAHGTLQALHQLAELLACQVHTDIPAPQIAAFANAISSLAREVLDNAEMRFCVADSATVV